MAYVPKLPILLFSLVFFAACAPKTSTKTPTEQPEPPVTQVDPNLSPCPKFSDAPNRDELENNYIIYRDFLKAQKYDQAFELWQMVYNGAPAADGKRTTLYEDGIWFYKRIYNGETDSLIRKEYVERIMKFFDEMAECYGEREWVGARKAFEYYYTFEGYATKKDIYNLFKTYIDFAGLKTQAFAINPFTALLVEGTISGEIPKSEAGMYDRKIKEIVTHNLATAKTADLEAWKIVDSYAPVRLSDLETIKGFYPCEYYLDKYYQQFLDNPEDCDNLREVFSWLKWADCPETDPKFQQLIKTGNENCKIESSPGAGKAYECLQNADYRCAIENFELAAAQTKETVKKAQYLLTIAKIYYNHLKNFSRARQCARDASKVRPNWGEPYLLVGRLYASSGPLCGPGRGWDSQIVTWVAIDEWNRAKSVDSAANSEANKLISRYTQYMPSREDIFQRGLSEGSSYTVPCWIQQATTIRAAN